MENPNSMELMLLVANFTKPEQIVKQLKEAILEYEKDPTESNLFSIGMYGSMILAKGSIEHSGGLLNVFKELESRRKIEKLFDHTKNQS